MKVELIITRKVLFEKISIIRDMEVFFLSFLEGCEIKLSDVYPNYIFYVKDDEILFQHANQKHIQYESRINYN